MSSSSLTQEEIALLKYENLGIEYINYINNLKREEAEREGKNLPKSVKEGDISYIGNYLDFWSSEAWDEQKEEYLQNLGQIMDDNRQFVSGGTCKNKDCRSTNTIFISVQDRSGDEGASNYIICKDCKRRFRV